MARGLLPLLTHAVALGVGFAAGIYALPLLTAPEAPAEGEVSQIADRARYVATFRRDLAGSDLLHWGEGDIYVSDDAVAFRGELAPGPDYRLYLAPGFPVTEEQFLSVKDVSVEIGRIATFDGFIVQTPAGVDVTSFDTAIVWCESFSQFITAARYRE